MFCIFICVQLLKLEVNMIFWPFILSLLMTTINLISTFTIVNDIRTIIPSAFHSISVENIDFEYFRVFIWKKKENPYQRKYEELLNMFTT